MPADDDIDDEDRRLFFEALRDVRPLPRGPGRVAPAGRVATPPPPRAPVPPVRRFTLDRVGGRVEGRAPDVARKLLQQLMRHPPPAPATLDLHGRTAEQARREIERFIKHAQLRGHEVVCIVHGRGFHSGGNRAVLPDVTVEALSEGACTAQVLGFVTAPAALGGEGALLVRLRRR